jgi:hypothetical protein
MSLTHKEGQRLMQSARNRTAGKPIQNNTRLFDHMDGSFGVVLHGTEVVTIHTDGTYTLRSGGFRTVTTMDRIRRWSPANKNWSLHSERGDWYIRMKPVDRDPQPERVERSIPRPFEASDPGDEPVKDPTGCKANQMVTTEHVDEIVEVWRKDVLDSDEIIKVLSDGFEPGGDYDKLSVKRSWNDHVFYTEDRYWSDEWAALAGDGHRSSFVNKDGERVTKIQCPHCAEFDAIHERWTRAYHGGSRWGRDGIDKQKGYKLYVEMMERFDGDRDAWQEAYITDFRARRAYLKADREWVNRNRVPFYDGITIDSEGWAPRVREKGPSPAKLRRHEREVERIKKRIETYLDGYIKALVKGMPMPGNGDCWYCLMKMPGDSHLDSHMKERYYVPSLAILAMRETTKLTDTGIAIWLNMNPDTHTMGGKDTGRKPYDSVKRALRKYMRSRLVPEAPTS